MEVKDISMRIVNKEGLKAICSINFENLLVVHNVRLVEGREGIFLSFPAKIKKSGDFLDIVHPINKDFREKLTKVVKDKYDELNK